MAVIQFWRVAGQERLAAAKGAPEAIFALSGLAPDETQHLVARVHQFAFASNVGGVRLGRRKGVGLRRFLLRPALRKGSAMDH
jgi:hypothetical protein